MNDIAHEKMLAHLRSLGACGEAIAAIASWKSSVRKTWMHPRHQPEWMLWYAVQINVDPRLVARALDACVDTVRSYVPDALALDTDAAAYAAGADILAAKAQADYAFDRGTKQQSDKATAEAAAANAVARFAEPHVAVRYIVTAHQCMDASVDLCGLIRAAIPVEMIVTAHLTKFGD
jgi:nucleoid-associated protein YgaU